MALNLAADSTLTLWRTRAFRVKKQVLRRELWHHDLCAGRKVKSGEAKPNRAGQAHAQGYLRRVSSRGRGADRTPRHTSAGAPGHGGGWVGGARLRGYKHHDVEAAAALPVPLPRKMPSYKYHLDVECRGGRGCSFPPSSGGRWRGIFRRKPFHSASYGGNNIPKCVLHSDYMRQWCSRCEAQMWIRASYCRLPASVCVCGWQTILLCTLLCGENIGKEFLWERDKKERTRSFCIFF